MHKLPKTEKMEYRNMERKPYETPTITEVDIGMVAPLLSGSGEDEYEHDFAMASNPDGGIA